MDPLRWMMKAKRWAQKPPSARQVAMYGGVIAASLLIAGIEWLWGWPAWLTVEQLRAKP
ncbi:hypothetical protein LHP98_03520 [Rhodobacter sp. Har01]|uniref:hypothetical protein n=1 Tax=Rhodobacter sp. Har01 TaxID=2883999 RepID=UPI001D092FB7|nr:hypothetical protein [Rhodobacter sp. Har01]MCB6177194.1 hypothetical protein [Rhodobacter sp. Har01]